MADIQRGQENFANAGPGVLPCGVCNMQIRAALRVAPPYEIPAGLFGVYICTYCGELATARDHVVPRAWSHGHRRGVSFSRIHVVPACDRCNSSLGAKPILTISKRAVFLLARAYRRDRKAAFMPEWSAAELAEMGPMMRANIRAGLEKKDIAIKRIRHLEMVASMEALTTTELWQYIDAL